MKTNLFRKRSLDTISTPDRINECIVVSGPSLYVVLTALCICVLGAGAWIMRGTVTEKVEINGLLFPYEGTADVSIPHSGIVRELYVERGEYVEKDQPLALVSVGESYSVVAAPFPGMVLSGKYNYDTFSSFEPLVHLVRQPPERLNKEVIAFVTFNDLRKLEVGQAVQVSPFDLPREQYGYMEGVVVAISHYPTTHEEVARRFKVSPYVGEILPEEAAFEVKVVLKSDPDNSNEPRWSFAKPERSELFLGTFCRLQIVTRKRYIYELLTEGIDNLKRQVSQMAE